MLFSSAEFLFIFLPIVLAGFFVLARSPWPMATLYWLLCCSIFYYGYWKIGYLWLLVGSILAAYWLGLLVARYRSRWVLASGILLLLSPLVYFKYSYFLSETAREAFGFSFDAVPKLLPLGISFITFQKIAYLVDVHAGVTAPARNLGRFGLFVSYFPQLIAGPIVHYRELAGQFERPGLLPGMAALNWQPAVVVFCCGLFKKLVLADYFAVPATVFYDAMAAGTTMGAVEAWVGTSAYTLQLYFDFSGYSDMAVGLALMCGIVLPINFLSPYQSANISEFWRRWHVTLSRFLRDYIYIPLGGNRQGLLRAAANMFVVMVIGGIWHGAGWNFVLWGALHGIALAAFLFWRRLGLFQLPKPLAIALTLLCVHLGWVFFRSPDAATAFRVLQVLVDFEQVSLPAGLAVPLQALTGISTRASLVFTDSVGLLLLLPAMAMAYLAVLWLPNIYKMLGIESLGEEGQPMVRMAGSGEPASPARSLRWALLAALAFALGLTQLFVGVQSPFLYFNF